MRFGITRLHLDPASFIEVSAEEFIQFKRCKNGFMVLLDIEEKLDIVLENYAEYERELLSLTLERSLFFDPSWSAVISDIHTVNRRLANLLTTSRLYIDQVKHDISKIYGPESPASHDLREHLRTEHSDKLGYRVMEELRNYIQHRGLPTHRIDYPNKTSFSRNDDNEIEVGNIKWGVTPSLSVDILREDGRLKKSVLDELAGMGNYVPITPLVRQYIEAIGRVHERLRDSTSVDLAEWKERLQSLINRGKEFFRKDLTGVALVAVNGLSDYIESEQIFEDLMKRHAFLAQKNLALKRISIQFVSGECVETAD